MWNKFHAEDPQILSAIVKIWSPGRPGARDFCTPDVAFLSVIPVLLTALLTVNCTAEHYNVCSFHRITMLIKSMIKSSMRCVRRLCRTGGSNLQNASQKSWREKDHMGDLVQMEE